MIDYDGRRFRSVANSANGEVSSATVFEYHQSGAMLSGTYAGGAIIVGELLGIVDPDGSLRFCYHHLSVDGNLRAGECHSIPTPLDDGRICLHESWRWFSGDRSRGVSTIEEIRSDKPGA